MCIHLKVSNSWLETALESEVGDRLTVGLIFMAARKEVNIESSMLDWTTRSDGEFDSQAEFDSNTQIVEQ